jgi:hypothetical protein
MGTQSIPDKLFLSPPALSRVICLYDFTSEDPCHLSFKRGDLLLVLQNELTGWTGARNEKRDMEGWVPTEYLAPLSGEQALHLKAVHDQVRFYEYEAEIRYRDAPVRDLNIPNDSNIELKLVRTTLLINELHWFSRSML